MRKARKPGINQRLLALFHLVPDMGDFLILIAIPLIASIAINLHNWSLYGDPKFVGAENYIRLLSGEDPTFYTVLGNALVFTIGYTAVNLATSTGTAAWLHSLPDWASFFRALFFIPAVIPMAANVLIWQVMLDDQGVINEVLAAIGIMDPFRLGHPTWTMVSLIVTLLQQVVGYNIVVLTAGLSNISPTIIEASKIDGTTAWNRFWQVTLPMLSPSLFSASVMTVIGAFKAFTQPFVLAKGGPGEFTNTLVLYLHRNALPCDKLGLASSLVWALFVPVILIMALQFIGQKKWMSHDS